MIIYALLTFTSFPHVHNIWTPYLTTTRVITTIVDIYLEFCNDHRELYNTICVVSKKVYPFLFSCTIKPCIVFQSISWYVYTFNTPFYWYPIFRVKCILPGVICENVKMTIPLDTPQNRTRDMCFVFFGKYPSKWQQKSKNLMTFYNVCWI